MNAINFIKQHGVEKAKEVVEGAPETATHFTEALGGHYAKEGMLKMKPQWLWFNSINKEWYYDFAAEDHIHLPDLKRLVESVDLVKKLSGIAVAKEKLAYGNSISAMRLSYETTINDRNGTKQNVITGVYLEDLEQAIADYEQIFGESK